MKKLSRTDRAILVEAERIRRRLNESSYLDEQVDHDPWLSCVAVTRDDGVEFFFSGDDYYQLLEDYDNALEAPPFEDWVLEYVESF